MRLRSVPTVAAAAFALGFALPGSAPAATGNPSPLQLAPSGTPLSNLACPSATQCTATAGARVITFTLAANGQAISHRWVRTPFMGRGVQINGIWCPLATMCTVFQGQSVTGFNPRGFRYRASRLVAPDYGEGLVGVRCPSRSECVAIDSFGHGATYNPQTDKTLRRTIAIDGNERLTALACPSATQCTALDDNGSQITFNPASGHRLNSARIDPAVGLDDPEQGEGNELDAVSCPTTGSCVAVDTLGNVITFRPLASAGGAATVAFTQHWNSISCRRTGQCVAVGDDGAVLAGSAGVVGGSSGPWTTATLPGATDLNAVACPSAGRCVAVDSSGHAFALVPAAL
jgi:hypothetical protein